MPLHNTNPLAVQVKFAGKEMQVVKLVTPGTVAAKAATDEVKVAAARAALSGAPAAAQGGSLSLATVVDNLGKVESISTIKKSSLDWDTYKYKEGIDDELNKVTKVRGGT